MCPYTFSVIRVNGKTTLLNMYPLFFLIFFIKQSFTTPLSVESQLRLEKIHNVTTLLDKLLDNYEKSFRPNMNSNKPTIVYIDIYVRSMGPISEQDGSYAIDCYFRQRWNDERLTFSSAENLTLSLGMSMLDKIWKPDTYFWNGKGSYLHKLTTPNRLVRLSGDGTILYSSRLTIKARCPMHLQKFPLDMQTCKLIVGSFGYRSHEVKYIWTKGLTYSVIVAPENKMSQFEVKGVRMFNTTEHVRDDASIPYNQAQYSALEVHFLLKRHLGFFMINFYIPCTLIVLLSWVAFWINREATADRITLGVTSVLTMTFLSVDSRSDLPRVEYPTALDIYILTCFAFLFICILEFALVHANTKYNTGDPELRGLERERIKERMEKVSIEMALIKHQNPAVTVGIRHRKLPMVGNGGCHSAPRFAKYDNIYDPDPSVTKLLNHQSLANAAVGLKRKASFPMRIYHQWSMNGKKEDPFSLEMNSTSKIDRVARILFPLGFTLISILYWNTYLNE